ncbi:hypothetical protein Tco_0591791 [Tanacetum coccineum]
MRRQRKDWQEMLKCKQLQEEYDKVRKKELKVNNCSVIDWNDPFVIRYNALQNRPDLSAESNSFICAYGILEKRSSKTKKSRSGVEAETAKTQRNG